MIKTGMSYSVDKQLGGRVLSGELKNSLKLFIPKNGTESFQISMLSDTDLCSLSLFFEGDTDGVVFETHIEKYISAKDSLFPDPLVPMKGEFSLDGGYVTTIVIRINTDANTRAGDRDIRVILKKDGTEILNTCELCLHIWNFVLSDRPKMATYIPVYRGSVAKHHGYGDLNELTPEKREEVDVLYKSYYDMLLTYGVSGGELPYDILDDRADAYMSDPRVTSFSVPYDVSEKKLVSYYNKLKSDPVWFDKAFVYIFDEPTTVEHLNTLKARVDKVKELCPDFAFMTAFYSDFDYDNDRDQIQFLLDTLQIVVPKLPCFNDSFIYTTEQMKKWPSFSKRMEDYKAKGNKVWTYVCWEPGKPYANLFVDEEGLDHRILFWQQYACGAQGFLYWASNYWNDVDDPWNNMSTVPWLDKNILGDGSLLYNGNKVGIKGACPSLRLEIIKDGLNDVKLLFMARDIFGDDFVNTIVSKVTRSTTVYVESSDVFFEAKRELGCALEDALGTK